jgi:hypothetical protein
MIFCFLFDHKYEVFFRRHVGFDRYNCPVDFVVRRCKRCDRVWIGVLSYDDVFLMVNDFEFRGLRRKFVDLAECRRYWGFGFVESVDYISRHYPELFIVPDRYDIINWRWR